MIILKTIMAGAVVMSPTVQAMEPIPATLQFNPKSEFGCSSGGALSPNQNLPAGSDVYVHGDDAGNNFDGFGNPACTWDELLERDDWPDASHVCEVPEGGLNLTPLPGQDKVTIFRNLEGKCEVHPPPDSLSFLDNTPTLVGLAIAGPLSCNSGGDFSPNETLPPNSFVFTEEQGLTEEFNGENPNCVWGHLSNDSIPFDEQYMCRVDPNKPLELNPLPGKDSVTILTDNNGICYTLPPPMPMV